MRRATLLRLVPDFERDDELPPTLLVDDRLPDVLLLLGFDDDFERELEAVNEDRLDVDEDGLLLLLFAREPLLDFDDADWPPPVELELLRALPVALLLEDFFTLDEPLEVELLRLPPDFDPDPEPELFDVDEDLPFEVDFDPPVRLEPDDDADHLAGTIVSAAAPTAPTAAPVAAPVRISPATSRTLSTNFEVVDRVDREELLLALFVLFFEEVDDAFAISFLPECS